MNRRKVAVVGARGIGHHGGFETVVSELAPRLHDIGYDVYCSHRRTQGQELIKNYRGVKPIYFPLRFPRRYAVAKIFELLYDWYYSVKCTFFMRCDIVYFLGVGVGFALFFAKMSGSRLIVNTDGLEWRRAKFSLIERVFVRLSYFASCVGADTLVLDNGQLAAHVPQRYRKKAVCIVNGVTVEECPGWDALLMRTCLGNRASAISPFGYWLVVARLEPENNIHTILKAYSVSKSAKPMVLVGDFSSERYEESVEGILRSLPPKKTVLRVGSVYDRKCLSMLRCHCLAYAHGHSVGGTNPSLLEAMSAGNIVIAHDNPFNREVCGDLALYFKDVKDLASIMNLVEESNRSLRQNAMALRQRAKDKYNWEGVVAAHDKLFSADTRSN